MAMMQLEFTRPSCVDDDEWKALSTLHDRLQRAMRDGDPELSLGTAKELCEAVAKITFQQRGERFTSRTDMPDLIQGAHRLIGRLPAESGAGGTAVRNLAQGAMKIATQLDLFRNQAGSGHGRPAPTGIDEVDARFAAGAALLWSAWVLARLDALVATDPDRLASDVLSLVFYSGDLTRRLTEAGLASMDERDQRVVGFAVGQRGGPGGTVNVFREGVLAASSTKDLSAWPAAYRQAVAEGLITDRNGYISISPSDVDVILDLVAPLPERGAPAVDHVRQVIASSEFAYTVTDESRRATVDRCRALVSASTGSLAQALEGLAEALAPEPSSSAP